MQRINKKLISKLCIGGITRSEITSLKKELYDLDASNLLNYISVCQSKLSELDDKIREVWQLEREANLLLIGLSAKLQEGYSLRNSYNDGYEDGKNGRFEKKANHPDKIIDKE